MCTSCRCAYAAGAFGSIESRMGIKVPELESIPEDQRRSVLDEAIRTVNTTHGKMSNVFHYVGCALVAAIVLPMAVTGKSIVAAALAGVAGYVLCLIVGFLDWGRATGRRLPAGVLRG